MRIYLTVLLLLLTGSAAADLRIVAIGDMPYAKPSDIEPKFPKFEALIKEINKTPPDLVIHVGDVRGTEKTTCSDEILNDQRVYMDKFDAPVLYTPGDNEWSDCHESKLGGYRPLERLDYIRKTFFDTPGQTLGGTTLTLDHQGDKQIPENARLIINDILIFSLHVVGPDDGKARNGGVDRKTFKARRKANLTWLLESFDVAKNAKAVVVALHADMFKGSRGFNKDDQRWREDSAFYEIGKSLNKAAKAFGKPVLLIYGDGHSHTVDWPFDKTNPNFTAVEVFGAWDVDAVDILITGERPRIYTSRLPNPLP